MPASSGVRAVVVVPLVAVAMNIVLVWAMFDLALPRYEAFRESLMSSIHRHPEGVVPVPAAGPRPGLAEDSGHSSWWIVAAGVAVLGMALSRCSPDRLLAFSYLQTLAILIVSALAVASPSVTRTIVQLAPFG